MIKRDWEEECGVFGVFDTEGVLQDAARMSYFGLFALQHRGQESAGIAVNQNGRIICHKEQGLVVEVFSEMTLQAMKGHAAIAHVRYPSSDESGFDSIQPMQIKSKSGHLAISHNGAITNADEIRNHLKQAGAIFQTSADFEVLLSLLARNRITTECIEEAILLMMAEIRGAYSMVIMTDNKLLGMRDPLGIRPLVLGRKGSCYVLASESCALDAVGAKLIRDILPGEVVTISKEGISSNYFVPENIAQKKGKICVFEFVYFARPDSVIDGASVYESRLNMGRALAKEAPCDCDLVVGAPDSGLAAAMGYALEAGLPYGSALLKNRYVGRTFVQPSQLQREMTVQLKFSVMKKAVEGKRILMVDDSIVRGTTTKHNIAMLREAGATEVHMRVASPPLCYPCFYGVNTPDQNELTAGLSSVEEVRRHIGADSLSYLSIDGLKASTAGIHCGHCSSCFDGEFPAGVPDSHKEKIHSIHW